MLRSRRNAFETTTMLGDAFQRFATATHLFDLMNVEMCVFVCMFDRTEDVQRVYASCPLQVAPLTVIH